MFYRVNRKDGAQTRRRLIRAPHRTERTKSRCKAATYRTGADEAGTGTDEEDDGTGDTASGTGGGGCRKAGVVVVELFAELLDLFLGRHVGGGGVTIVVGVPGETEEVEGRRDASLRQIDHAVVHQHEGLPARALPCLLVSLAITRDDGLDLPIPKVVKQDVAGDANLTYEGAINLVGGC